MNLEDIALKAVGVGVTIGSVGYGLSTLYQGIFKDVDWTQAATNNETVYATAIAGVSGAVYGLLKYIGKD